MSRETREGACHCGAVKFRATLPDGLAGASRCTCSICRMRGAVSLTASAVGVTDGEDHNALYQFNTRTAEHHFCRLCGIYTFHRRRSDPRQFGVNAACLDGVSPFDFADLPVSDGEHHTSDGHAPRLAGRLRFEKT